MSTAKFNTWLNPDGTENYKCRAWVNFNGTGTVAIRAAGNVASITDNGTGNYTVNFTTAMPDANYAPVVSASAFQNGTNVTVASLYNYNDNTYYPTTSGVRVQIVATGGGGVASDSAFITATIFR
jgi:hypothetical protein